MMRFFIKKNRNLKQKACQLGRVRGGGLWSNWCNSKKEYSSSWGLSKDFALSGSKSTSNSRNSNQNLASHFHFPLCWNLSNANEINFNRKSGGFKGIAIQNWGGFVICAWVTVVELFKNMIFCSFAQFISDSSFFNKIIIFMPLSWIDLVVIVGNV